MIKVADFEISIDTLSVAYSEGTDSKPGKVFLSINDDVMVLTADQAEDLAQALNKASQRT